MCNETRISSDKTPICYSTLYTARKQLFQFRCGPPSWPPFHTFQKHHPSRVTSCHHCKYVHHSIIHALLLKSVCTSLPDTTRTRTRMSSGCLIGSMGPHTMRRKVELLQEKRTSSGESCTIHRGASTLGRVLWGSSSISPDIPRLIPRLIPTL